MKTITIEKATELYNDMLNEISGDVYIGSLRYEAAYVLREIDAIAYNVGLSDYIDSISDEYSVEGY